jgi:hypothetical protein
MKNVQFKDVPQDGLFVLNGVEYKKIPEKRISCCRSVNAVKSDDPKTRVQITPITEVQVNDEL